MLDFIFTTDQLKESQFIIVYNNKKDLLKKQGKEDKSGQPIFLHDDILKIHGAHRECVWNKEQLDKFFKKDEIEARLKTYNKYGWIETVFCDVHDHKEAYDIMKKMAGRLKEV